MERTTASKAGRILRLLIVAALCMDLAGWIVLTMQPEDAHGAELVQIAHTGSVPYAGYSTMGMVNQDGSYVYCAQPAQNTPQPGSYERRDLSFAFAKPSQDADLRVKMIRAICWFGYGGPGFNASLWPSAWYDGSAMTQGDYYALTHILISDLYAVDAGAAMTGCNAAFRSWCLSQVIGFDDAGGPVNRTGDGAATRWKLHDRIGEVPDGFSVYAISTGQGSQVCVSYDKGGWVRVAKASSNTAITDGNASYSLDGARYGLYDRGGRQVAELVCDASGSSSASGYLAAGSYTLREIESPYGYALNSSDVSVNVENGKTTTVQTKDAPQAARPELLLNKLDAETMQPYPLAGASLGGARYQVRYYDGFYESSEACEASGGATRTWTFATDEDGRITLDDAHLAAGDALYTDGSGNPVLPLGTYVFAETGAPAGYVLDATPQIVQVTPEGSSAVVETYRTVTHPEQVKRGDAELSKRNGNTMEGLALVPFLVTSRSTGESHVVVTDENGYWSSSSDFVLHTDATNANDAALSYGEDGEVALDEEMLDAKAGVWFGRDAQGSEAPADDALGALPYDTYDIAELPCSANEGLQLLSLALNVSRDGYAVDLGTLDDLPASIATHARSAAGGSVVYADPASTVVDRIDYTGLVAGQSYTAYGTLVNTADSSVIGMAEREFTAQSASGSIEVVFEPFDSTTLGATTLACTERLVDSQGRLIATHEDLADSEQQVVVAPGQVMTSLANASDGTQEVPAEGWVTITDTLSWRNLVIGQEYEAVGKLVHKSDGSALEDGDGNAVTARATFTPEESSGTASVSFVVDASTLVGGDELVAFEEVYRENTLIASHADLQATAQTVTVAAQENKDVPEDAGKGASLPKTGETDRRPAAAALGALALISAALLIVNHRLRRHSAKVSDKH